MSAGAADESKAAEELTVGTFADLVSSASRLLTSFGALEPFRQAKVGLAEWTMMTLVSEDPNMTSAQVARQLGVTAQRVNQLADSLKALDWISLQPQADDSRKMVIHITDTGRRELNRLNESLQPLLLAPVKDNPKIVVRTVRGMRRLVKMTTPAPGKAKGQKRGRAEPPVQA